MTNQPRIRTTHIGLDRARMIEMNRRFEAEYRRYQRCRQQERIILGVMAMLAIVVVVAAGWMIATAGR